MPVNYEWTPQTGQYVKRSETVQLFREVHHCINSMVCCVEKWVDSPSGATGIAHLAESEKHYDKAYAALEAMDHATHREMSRLYEVYAFIKSFFYAAKEDRLDSRLAFGSGMKVQQTLDALRRLRDEWKQVMEYAEE